VRLPAGTRDWLPPELRRKRSVENVLRGVFERWAYEEVQTPNFERFDALEAGLGTTLAAKTFLFTDKKGTQIALRPEMTTPVARLVATRMREAPMPLRLSYVVPAYRYEEPQEGRMREFTTAGLELIGAPSVDADAESLFTAFEALDALGLHDAHVDINHVAIVDGVLAGLELDAFAHAECKTMISGRNIVALRARLAGTGAPDDVEAVVRLALTRGREDVLETAAGLCRTDAGLTGIARLRELLARAERLGYGGRLNVDCSLLRDIEYYTGFIFEGFANEVGFGLCGGGRYDTLLPRFGFDSGAVGWSLSIERILIALERRHSVRFGQAPAIDVLVSGSDVIAARERAAGKIVRIDFEQRGEAELLDEARRQKIPRLVIANGSGVKDIEVTW
jgi:ATP phosphoribosyltransferase regulatory subunit